MTWTVHSSEGMSYTDQAAFVLMVENAIKRYGSSSNRSDVAEYVGEACQQEWPSSSEKWFVAYDTNVGWGYWAENVQKKMCVKEGDDYVYAIRH